MGTVWLAHDQVLETDVALKEIGIAGGLSDDERADRVERALREARHTARLRGHPHVVTVHDVVPEDGLPWIVMEYVPSRSLFQVVRDDGPLPPHEVARIGLAVVDALASAHEHGILHRDVKPSNVLVGEAGRVVLTDFGIATHDDDPTLTVTGIVGTPMYMAPERLNNTPATPGADLFGLGATLYFAVEGEPPFKRDSFGAMLTAILLQPPAPMRRAGPLADVILGLLDKNPKSRLTAAQARRLLDKLTVVAPATPPTPQPPTPQPPTPLPPAMPSGSGLTQLTVPGRPARPAPGEAVAPVPVGGTGRRPLPPSRLSATEEDGMVVLRWAPSPSPGVSYQVTRVVEDPNAPNGRRERSLGNTHATELFDVGVPKGVRVWHEVTATIPGDMGSVPVRTPTLVVLPDVTALRVDMDGDAVTLSWRSHPGLDDVVIERRYAESSSIRGAMRIFYASGSHFIDRAAQPGATYRYRVRVEQATSSGAPRLSHGSDVEVTVVARPRPVTDLDIDSSTGQTVLRWTSVPGAAVRVFATPTSAAPGLAGTSPFGAPDHEVPAGSVEGRARLVGESRRGRLVDTAATGDTVYTPVSVSGDRAVIGRAVRHTFSRHN
jgi:serine/threonine protein kinase